MGFLGYKSRKELLQENKEKDEQIAKSGSTYWLNSAREWEQRYSEQRMELYDLRAQVKALTAENESLKERLEKILSESREERIRNRKGQYQSADGISGDEKEHKAWYMYQQGYSREQIADALGIRYASVPVYISRAKKQTVWVSNDEGQMYSVPRGEIRHGVWLKDKTFRMVAK